MIQQICFSIMILYLIKNLSTTNSWGLLQPIKSRGAMKRKDSSLAKQTLCSTLLCAKNGKKHAKTNNNTPTLVIFNLDGCLRSLEMYEILHFMGGRGSPVLPDDRDPKI